MIAFQKLFLVAILFTELTSINALAANYTVDAPGKLTTIAIQIQSAAPGEKHVIQFKTYTNVGSFTLNGITADSIIFQRAEESAEVVEFSGTLFQMQNVNANVVFRNLAFKAKTGSSIFIDGIATGKPNRNLTIDSCQIFADTLNTTFLAWSAETGTGSTMLIKRSIIFGAMGSKGNIDITADTVRVINCYLNYSGLFLGKAPKRTLLSNSTFNRVQFDLSGKITGVYSIQSNLFGYPPLQDKLGDIKNVFVMSLSSYSTGVALNNGRFSTWYGFNLPSDDGFSDPSNISVSSFGDSLSFWDFKQTAETTRGYQNPLSAGFPAYNVFPGETSYKTKLSNQDSIVFNISSGQIPRVISANYSVVTYPSSLDSTRWIWAKDTAIGISGPVTISSIEMPKINPQGIPILFSEFNSSFSPSANGVEGALTFTNTTPTAKKFIPTFGGQNTFRGSSVSIKGIGVDTSFIFSAITKSGRTVFQNPVLKSVSKRIRVLKVAGNGFGFKDSTTCEGTGLIRFGFSKTGLDLPLKPDSLAWLISDTLSSVKDSLGKYWGTHNFSKTTQGVLIEKLGAGTGIDTNQFSLGSIRTVSSNGHQLTVDSSFQPTLSLYPDMASFSKGYLIKWPGRGSGDSLTLSIKRSSIFQKIYFKDGTKATVFPFETDTLNLSLTVPLSIADSNKIFFLAQKYQIPAGIKTSVIQRADTLKNIMSSTPGDLALDTSVVIQGLKTDSQYWN